MFEVVEAVLEVVEVVDKLVDVVVKLVLEEVEVELVDEVEVVCVVVVVLDRVTA